MYKKVYNGMYKYIIIKICSKHDTATNTTAFLIMHCVLLTVVVGRTNAGSEIT